MKIKLQNLQNLNDFNDDSNNDNHHYQVPSSLIYERQKFLNKVNNNNKILIILLPIQLLDLLIIWH